MTIHAERAFFERLLPTGSSLVKKCPLMTSLERKFHFYTLLNGLVPLYYYLNILYYAKITLKVKIVFFIMNKKRKVDIFIDVR